MTLVKMKELLERAQKNNIGCGAFSVGNMEMVRGAVRAAEDNKDWLGYNRFFESNLRKTQCGEE